MQQVIFVPCAVVIDPFIRAQGSKKRTLRFWEARVCGWRSFSKCRTRVLNLVVLQCRTRDPGKAAHQAPEIRIWSGLLRLSMLPTLPP